METHGSNTRKYATHIYKHVQLSLPCYNIQTYLSLHSKLIAKGKVPTQTKQKKKNIM